MQKILILFLIFSNIIFGAVIEVDSVTKNTNGIYNRSVFYDDEGYRWECIFSIFENSIETNYSIRISGYNSSKKLMKSFDFQYLEDGNKPLPEYMPPLEYIKLYKFFVVYSLHDSDENKSKYDNEGYDLGYTLYKNGQTYSYKNSHIVNSHFYELMPYCKEAIIKTRLKEMYEKNFKNKNKEAVKSFNFLWDIMLEQTNKLIELEQKRGIKYKL